MKRFLATFVCVAALTGATGFACAAPGDPIAKSGDTIVGKLQATLDSKTAHDGDKFSLAEQSTIFHHNAALRGATIDGHVENVTPAGPTHKATMDVFFDDIRLADGTTLPIAAKVQSIAPPTHHIRDLGLIVGGAVTGHIVGSKMGKKHGGLAGAAAGFALASTMKSNIVVHAGTIMNMKLTQPLVASASM